MCKGPVFSLHYCLQNYVRNHDVVIDIREQQHGMLASQVHLYKKNAPFKKTTSHVSQLSVLTLTEVYSPHQGPHWAQNMVDGNTLWMEELGGHEDCRSPHCKGAGKEMEPFNHNTWQVYIALQLNLELPCGRDRSHSMLHLRVKSTKDSRHQPISDANKREMTKTERSPK